mmetsp:Transcript_11602/g.32269  ORF Transcript_11602/g.32269 Transcript_11602/m.32269 type:complete len:245 (-) Transcript_11602:369-1103(-)
MLLLVLPLLLLLCDKHLHDLHLGKDWHLKARSVRASRQRRGPVGLPIGISTNLLRESLAPCNAFHKGQHLLTPCELRGCSIISAIRAVGIPVLRLRSIHGILEPRFQPLLRTHTDVAGLILQPLRQFGPAPAPLHKVVYHTVHHPELRIVLRHVQDRLHEENRSLLRTSIAQFNERGAEAEDPEISQSASVDSLANHARHTLGAGQITSAIELQETTSGPGSGRAATHHTADHRVVFLAVLRDS